MKFSQVVVKYHKKISGGNEKKIYLNQFSSKKIKLKNGHFWPPLHKSRLIFHAHAVDMQNFYEFTNLNSSKLQ